MALVKNLANFKFYNYFFGSPSGIGTLRFEGVVIQLGYLSTSSF
jgi:hypothetical protein